MCFSIPLIFFNLKAASSGLIFYDGLYDALYEVTMTELGLAFYCWFEITADHKFKDPGFLSSYLPELYNHNKVAETKTMLQKFGIWSLFAWYSGAVFFYVSFYAINGVNVISNESGKVDGLWTAGFGSLVMLWAINHIIIFIGTRNWTIAIILGYLASISGFIPFTLLLVEYTNTHMSHTTFTDVLPSSVFLPTVLVGTALVYMPYYFAKCMREIVYHPSYFTQAGIDSFTVKAKDEKEKERKFSTLISFSDDENGEPNADSC